MKPVESKMNPPESPVAPSKLPPNPTNPEKSQKIPQKKRSKLVRVELGSKKPYTDATQVSLKPIQIDPK